MMGMGHIILDRIAFGGRIYELGEPRSCT
jgi:hypothetical protein